MSFNFTIVQAPPSISSLSPASGYRGSNYLIVIDGQYLSGASITTTNPGIAVDNLNITDSRITVVFYISPSAAEGAATVSVSTAAGKATAPFTVTGPSTAGPPSITGIQINDGKASIRPGTTGALTVCGGNLETASLAVSSSAVSLGSAIYDRSSGCLSAMISVQSSAEEDVVDLFATNPMGRAATRFAIGEEGSGILFVKPGLIAPILVGESRSVQALVRFIEVVSTVIFLGPIVDVDQRFNRQIIKFRFIAVPIVFALVSTSPADGAAWSIEPPGSNVFSLATGGPSATNTIRGESEGSATLVVTESSTINKVVRRTIVVAQVVPPQPQPGQTVTLSVSLVDGPVSVERTNGIISGRWFRFRVEARDQSGSPVSVSVRFSSDFLRTDLGEQIPSTATVPGSAAFNALFRVIAGTSPTRVLMVESLFAPTAVLNLAMWFNVIATREGLVGETTACGRKIAPNDQFVALPSTGLCGRGILLHNPNNAGVIVSTTVEEVGPWFPNTPVPGGFNQCNGGNDNYWNIREGAGRA